MNRYPVYVISKNRFSLRKHSAQFLIDDGVDCKIVVEPQEYKQYSDRFGEHRCLVLPFSNLGQGSIPARNWIWEHSKSLSFKRHWIFDDNIGKINTFKNGKRVKCNAIEALEKTERFVEQFSNVAICGITYRFFTPRGCKPFWLNCHAYSTLLILNELPFRWRGRYNEDTDLCLQALTSNWCTVNINAFSTDKAATMTCKGGNTDELYKDNGRLKMARSLEFEWQKKYPGLVKTVYKFGRTQHSVKWRMFKTQLKRIELDTQHNETQPKDRLKHG